MAGVTRRAATVCVLAGALAAMVSAADVLSQLGIPPQAAREAVDSVINSGVFNPGLPAKAFTLLPAAARGDVATLGMAWLKTYTASADFKQQYARIRETHKPSPPQFEGTPEDEVRKADEEQKQQAEDSKKALASLPADQRAQIEEAIKAAQAIIAQMNTPEMKKIRLDGIRAGRADRTKQYEQEVQNWKRDYPESPAPVIAKRLREYLALSADIDYAAKLTSRGGQMVFENPAYESKGSPWKMCYRAGKEATGAARAAAQAWLKELGG
jgi:hypothetical protein